MRLSSVSTAHVRQPRLEGLSLALHVPAPRASSASPATGEVRAETEPRRGPSREAALGRARFGEGLPQQRLHAQIAGGLGRGTERSGSAGQPSLGETVGASADGRIASGSGDDGLRYSRATVEALPTGEEDNLRAHADQHFASWEIVTADGQPVPTDDVRYRRALRGLVALSGEDSRGTHTDLNANGVDLTVEVDADGHARATVFEGQTRTRTDAPEPPAPDIDDARWARGEELPEVVTSADALGERYGVQIGEGFSEPELDRLSTALAMLSDDERAQIAGTEFVRAEEAPAGATGAECLGQAFERGASDGAHHRIELYDAAFAEDPHRFAGDGELRRDSSVQTTLHEIAHVLDFENGASRRFERAHDDLAPVTRYGEESAAEGFAEAFALYHTDPAYLATHRSEMHDWFGRGEHLE